MEQARYDLGASWREAVWRDVRYGVRMLRNAPGFTAIAIITLALGIGANTAAFSIVNAWLLRPLPLKDPQHLVAIWRTRAEAPRQPAYFNLYHDYLVWAAQNRSFDSLGATFEQGYALIGAGEPQQLEGAIATWNLFSTVGAKPAMGRLFVADDVRGEPACIISHALWAKQFHSSRDVIGQSIALNGKLYRILGVLPANFSLRVLDRPFETEVWTLITADDPNYSAASPAAMAVVGRLKPGVTAAQAEADLAGIQRELDKRFTGPRNSGVLAVNLQQDNTRTIRSSLLLLFGAVAVLLLIACVNAGSLILGRNSQRAREFAVRVALGCSARRLLQQLTAEVLMLFAAGGLAGLLVAFVLIRLFIAWNPFSVLPPGGISLDFIVLGVMAAIICVSALLFGSLPATHALRIGQGEVLRAGSTFTSARAQVRSRAAFVVAEIALSVILLVGAGLLISTFIKIDSEPLGFQTYGVFVSDVALPLARYKAIADQSQFADAVLQRLRTVPGIRAAGLALNWPFNVNGLGPIEIEGVPAPSAEQFPQAATFTVSSGYFDALGVSLLRGRTFVQSDRAASEPVTIISDEMARRYFADQDPVGKRIRLRSIDEKQPSEPWLTIIGVVGNTRSVRYNQITWDNYPEVYSSIFQRAEPRVSTHNFDSLTFYIYLQIAHPIEASAIAAAVHSVDPNLPVGKLRSTGEIVSSLRSQPRVRAALISSFGLLTLLLAAVGIYGVMTQLVEQRRREMGVRLALGAEASNIVRLVLQRGLTLAMVGIVLGAVGAAALSQYVRSFLYGISAFDPITFAAVVVVLAAVAVLASYVPARRATKVDPSVILRSE